LSQKVGRGYKYEAKRKTANNLKVLGKKAMLARGGKSRSSGRTEGTRNQNQLLNVKKNITQSEGR